MQKSWAYHDFANVRIMDARLKLYFNEIGIVFRRDHQVFGTVFRTGSYSLYGIMNTRGEIS